MAMFKDQPQRPENYRRFERPVPDWFSDAKLGIFIHWGPYSVPAWAEPIGELGTIEPHHWFAHNPYAEWYYNTIRIPGSPAAQHQAEVYGGAPYDDFIDGWDAAEFDADAVLKLIASTGARYFVPTTKHHDGVTLWDAPGTGDRNTVRRGPHRDLIGEFAAATRAAGLRFGVYYSGGLDWHFSQLPAITGDDEEFPKPQDAAYAQYAYEHVADLIEKYRPEVLWGDIDWPDAGKPDGPFSLTGLFDAFYAAAPDGVANDRWGETHWDFRTSEYQAGLDSEGAGGWENCRGIGFSFGYNQLEDASHVLSGPAAVRHLVDVVSRGGNLLLNIGLTAAGTVPPLQRATLEHLGAWNAANGHAVFGSRALDGAQASEEPWLRWTGTPGAAHLFADAAGEIVLPGLPEGVGAAGARSASGAAVEVRTAEDGVHVALPQTTIEGPVLVTFDRR